MVSGRFEFPKEQSVVKNLANWKANGAEFLRTCQNDINKCNAIYLLIVEKFDEKKNVNNGSEYISTP